MSGIAGIFHIPIAKPVDPARVRAMVDAQAHRGPDGAGVWTAPGVGLGLRKDGAGPLVGADGAIAVVHDGAIQNAAALRAELTAYGHVFETIGDAELILQGWRQWGPACLDHFDGSFAFALFDAQRQCLFLARDRLGVKPLHYAALADGSLIFSSELKGLLANPLLRREPDIRAVEDYLALGYVPDDACIIAGVRKLAAGHSLLVQRGKSLAEPTRWWDVDFTARATGSTGALRDEMRDHLRRAVRSSMAADGPVGALLSGGMNSSAIVALMAEASNRAVQTCAIAFADESRHADLIVGRFLTDHRKCSVDPADFAPLDRLAFDEPFADASALAFHLYRYARKSMTVALSGHGGETVMAGRRIRTLLPQRLQALLSSRGASGADLPASLTTPEFRAALNGHRAEAQFERMMHDAPAENPQTRARYAALKIDLPGHVLTRLDRTSMALGLEIRTPLLDHRLVQFAAGLSLRWGGGKGLMKQALEPYLPAEILRRRKARFTPPVDRWFRDGLAEDARRLAHGSVLAETGWFDRTALARIADAHLSGAGDHGQLLWQLLMLDKALGRLFGRT